MERKHGANDKTIKKLLEGVPSRKLEDALSHEVWAGNFKTGRFGYSPYHVIYGKSPFLPGISDGSILTIANDDLD